MYQSTTLPGGRRHALRLGATDFAEPGAYLITIRTADRAPILGEVTAGVLAPSDAGRIVRREWLRTGFLRWDVRLDAFVAMPDHVHAIVLLDDVREDGAPRRTRLGSLIGGFKASCAVSINELRDTPGAPVWQRGYFERVLRDEDEVREVRRHVYENPLRWRGARAGSGNDSGAATRPPR